MIHLLNAHMWCSFFVTIYVRARRNVGKANRTMSPTPLTEFTSAPWAHDLAWSISTDVMNATPYQLSYEEEIWPTRKQEEVPSPMSFF